jgi:DNA invertase Pin-like site-specific DNA recombinase
MQPIAYSLLRFSTPEQARGDSWRRQTDGAKRWSEEKKVPLDTSLWLFDPAVSAYTGIHRSNPDRHALAAFLKLVEDEKVPRGSYLILENLDRLTREHVRAGLMLCLGLIENGIRLVQLSPTEMIYDEKSDEMALMLMIVELSRGHRESKMKSERVGKAWREKKLRAAEEPLTERLPAWIELRGGKLVLVPDKAETVRHVFRLARDGYGIGTITAKLNRDGVKPLGKFEIKEGRKRSAFASHWARSYVNKILHNRVVLGEYQPHTGRGRNRKPDGDPVPGYYPAVLTEQDWFAAHAGLAQRKLKPGRPAKAGVNVFQGLLRDARDGSSLQHVDKGKKGGGRVLLSANAINGLLGSRAVSFPFVTFERAVLSMLAEVDPADVLSQDDKPDEVAILSGQLAAVEAKIGEVAGELLNGSVAALAKVLRQLEAQKEELETQLAETRQRAAAPVDEAWREAKDLLAVLDNAEDPDDARTRLRGLLRRIVSEIRVLVVPRGRDRLAAVQVWFTDAARCRSYLVLRRPATGGSVGTRPAAWWARSLAEVVNPGDLDLRDPGHARCLEQALLVAETGRVEQGGGPASAC